MELTSVNLPETKKKFLELHYGTKKVSEYNEEDLKKLFKFILALCKLIGVTEAPDNEIIMLLINHIQEYHGDFSKEEIQKAFGMAMADELGIDFKHFNRLPPQLISLVLNAYKALRSKEVAALNQILSDREILEKAERNKPTPEQAIQNSINHCLYFFKDYSEKKNNPKKDDVELRDWGSLNYKFLSKIGLIALSQEEKDATLEQAKRELLAEKEKEKLSGRGRKGIADAILEISNGTSTELAVKARQVALNNYFEYVITSKIDLENELQNASKSGGKEN